MPNTSGWTSEVRTGKCMSGDLSKSDCYCGSRGGGRG